MARWRWSSWCWVTMSCGWGTTSIPGRMMLPSHNSWRSSAVRSVSQKKEDIEKKINVGSILHPSSVSKEMLASTFTQKEGRVRDRVWWWLGIKIRCRLFGQSILSKGRREFFGKCRLFSYNLFAAIRINIGRKLAAVRLFELHEICVLFRKHYIFSLSHDFISTLV